MFNPAMLILAFEARRRGAGGAELAPLLLPLPGPAGAVLSAATTIRAQDRLNAMQQEMKDLGIGPDGPVKITQQAQPQMYEIVSRKTRESDRLRRARLEDLQIAKMERELQLTPAPAPAPTPTGGSQPRPS
jgi:hypothetical protein